MEKTEKNSFRIVDMQELCNLLTYNGYRLIKLASSDASGNTVDRECPESGENANGSKLQEAGQSYIEWSIPETARQDTILEKEMMRARRKAELVKLEAEVDNPELVSALRRWRRRKAASLNVPAFYVLANKTLLTIALAAPATMEELLSVKGFGPLLAEKYGQELLDLIAGIMEEADADSQQVL